jgi:glycosyltransferase involved in cell wall biosynthesis
MSILKLVYITAQAPYGRGETFINEEILAIKDKVELFIFPRNPEKEIFHKEAETLSDYTIWLPLINLKMFLNFLLFLIIKPRVWKVIINIFKHSRTLPILMKNLMVLPKGVYISKIIGKMKIDHIHAHWGSTTSTMAYIVSQLTDIPWSFTLHRWDIKENNMLKEKAKTAKFVRIISRDGYNKVLRIIGDEHINKCFILHMGVDIPKFTNESKKRDRKSFIIATPANLIEVKGHKYLIEAIGILRQKGYNIKCYLSGDGPLREDLEKTVNEMNLGDIVIFKGAIPHNQLLELYANNEVDCVILPSIVTDKGEHEGIPVSLMEAMAYKIPVISTNTGGIPELLDNDAGIIVEQKNPYKLAEAIETLIKDEGLRRKLGESGYKKVIEEFSLPNIVTKLLELMKE